MKSLLVAVFLFTAFSIRAQTSTPGQDSMDSWISQQLRTQPPNESVLSLQPLKPNEVKVNGLTYSGILVELANTDRPLELLNPAAPPAYGSSEDNIVRDPISRRVLGLKLFSIQF
jgi:hypothetical protein